MKIYIDADACPEKILLFLKANAKIPVILVTSF